MHFHALPGIRAAQSDPFRGLPEGHDLIKVPDRHFQKSDIHMYFAFFTYAAHSGEAADRIHNIPGPGLYLKNRR